MKNTILLILDGWGIAPKSNGNAVSHAHMPNVNSILGKYPHARLKCSGREVGLPDGFMGNSEVGHMNIGAGRVVYQDMTRIDLAIEDASFYKNPSLLELVEKTKAKNGRLHFMGLLSNGGVHSHIDHLFALIEMAKKHSVPVIVHAFMDGRDTPPTSGRGFVQKLLEFMDKVSWGKLGVVCGRYYAMDRDNRWERVKLAWDALVNGVGTIALDPLTMIDKLYSQNETDEFFKPFICASEKELQASKVTSSVDTVPQFSDATMGATMGATIKDNDGVFFFNFRADRARELTKAFISPAFNCFERGAMPKLASFASMTAYEDDFSIPVAFKKDPLKKGLGELVSSYGWQQLRIAETEKYAHVTYFFSCGREEPFKGEERRLIASPRDVATYDFKPEMSAVEVTNCLIDEWNSDKYSLVVCNLANLDMVGHTGNIKAAEKACEVIDQCVGRIVEAALAKNGRVFLTADHGNAEQMLDSSGNMHTAHTLNPVYFVLIEGSENRQHFDLLPEGKLGDIAPTILAAWGKDVPEEMTGHSLLKEQGK